MVPMNSSDVLTFCSKMKLNSRNVVDGKDEHLSGEPEQIRAYRDTWELGIHSYLGYLKYRLLVAKELLTESGSCFVQISDENVHLLRSMMDEVFGSENFVNEITFVKTAAQSSTVLPSVADYIIWDAKDKELMKYRGLYRDKIELSTMQDAYSWVMFSDGNFRKASKEEVYGIKNLPKDSQLYRLSPLTSQRPPGFFEFEFEGRKFTPGKQFWKTHEKGLNKLKQKGRLQASGKTLFFRLFLDDFPYVGYNNVWTDTQASFGQKDYVVQTNSKVIQRCLLMCTDPGDLILDPTCGSGTSAYVAEQWGRRWITIDTSRIAVNIAKTRLMTANFPYYELYDQQGEDIRQGFIYKKVPHIMLKALANDEPFDEETLYDQPQEDKKKIRVAGPFTVETLQSFEPVSPESLDQPAAHNGESENFEERIFDHLKSAGVKNGIKNEQAVFIRIDRLSSGYLHAEGFYQTTEGECKAYIHIGPKFGTVSKQAVNYATKECRNRGDGDWLIILGFSFESNIDNQQVTTSQGSFEVSKVRMHDDLMQDGLLKKDKKAASFVTIGEPDVALIQSGGNSELPPDFAQVQILGLDIYDPIKDRVTERNIADIAYWMVDDDYDGSNFVVKQIFFCGGDKNEFDKWRRGLDNLAKRNTKRQAEFTLGIEIDDEAFDRLYGHTSHPFPVKPGQKVAVRVISQFGEESTKVVGV